MRLASVTQFIPPAPAQVWAVLTDFAHPQRLAPTIDHCVVVGEGIGARRTITSSRGLRIEEEMIECDAARFRFAYEVLPSGDMPFRGIDTYRATVTLVPEGEGTRITWSAEGALSGPSDGAEEFLVELYRGAIARIAVLAMDRA